MATCTNDLLLSSADKDSPSVNAWMATWLDYLKESVSYDSLCYWGFLALPVSSFVPLDWGWMELVFFFNESSRSTFSTTASSSDGTAATWTRPTRRTPTTRRRGCTRTGTSFRRSGAAAPMAVASGTDPVSSSLAGPIWHGSIASLWVIWKKNRTCEVYRFTKSLKLLVLLVYSLVRSQ